METIQVVALGQEIMAKMKEEINQRDKDANPIPTVNPPVEENLVPPHGNILVQILVGAFEGGPPHVLNPPVIEIENQQDAFFSPRVASVYDAFGPTTNEVEK